MDANPASETTADKGMFSDGTSCDLHPSKLINRKISCTEGTDPFQVKGKHLLLLAVVIGGLLSGCGSAEPNGSPFVSQVISTQKTWPADFFDAADQGVLAKKVTSQEAFEQLWADFGYQAPPPVPNWEQQAVIFLGIIESGSCPYSLQSLQLDEEKTLHIRLQTEPDKACTDDATPRSFVISVDAEALADTEWVILENFGGLTPKVKLHEIDKPVSSV